MPDYGGITFDKNPFQKWSSRVGRVLDIISHPCSPSPEVWVHAFFTAIPTLLLTPICASPTDFLIRRLLGAGCKKPSFDFDVWATEEAPAVEFKGLQWVAFKGAQFLSRALWEMAVIDAFTGYFVNWTSAAYQYAGCKYPGEAYLQQSVIPNQIPGYASGQYKVDFTVDDYHIFQGGGTSIYTPGGYNPSIRFNPQGDPWSGAPTDKATIVNSFVRRDSDGRSFAYANGASADGSHSSAQGVSLQTNEGETAQTWTPIITKTKGWMVLSGDLSVFGRPHRDNIKPSCAPG